MLADHPPAGTPSLALRFGSCENRVDTVLSSHTPVVLIVTTGRALRGGSRVTSRVSPRDSPWRGQPREWRGDRRQFIRSAAEAGPRPARSRRCAPSCRCHKLVSWLAPTLAHLGLDACAVPGLGMPLSERPGASVEARRAAVVGLDGGPGAVSTHPLAREVGVAPWTLYRGRSTCSWGNRIETTWASTSLGPASTASRPDASRQSRVDVSF